MDADGLIGGIWHGSFLLIEATYTATLASRTASVKNGRLQQRVRQHSGMQTYATGILIPSSRGSTSTDATGLSSESMGADSETQRNPLSTFQSSYAINNSCLTRDYPACFSRLSHLDRCRCLASRDFAAPAIDDGTHHMSCHCCQSTATRGELRVFSCCGTTLF